MRFGNHRRLSQQAEMNRKSHKQRLVAEINITPFTDVILVLLTIFIVATPLIFQASIKVKLPEAATAKSDKDINQIYITITNESIVYLDKDPLTTKELKYKVRVIYRQNPNLVVILRADRFVRFKDIVGVLDALSELGIRNINLATANEENP